MVEGNNITKQIGKLMEVAILWGCYFVLISIMTYALFGEDKKRARRKERRIPERTLLILSLLGGSAGALMGMYHFHHKTRKSKFRIGVPAILAVQIIFAVCIVLKFV